MKKALAIATFLVVSLGLLVVFTTLWTGAVMLRPTPLEWLGIGVVALVAFAALALSGTLALPCRETFWKTVMTSASVMGLGIFCFILFAFLSRSEVGGAVGFYGMTWLGRQVISRKYP